MSTVKIGFVGVGDISGIYLKNITERFKEIEIAGICDLVREKAERAAEKYGIKKIYKDMYELFADDEVDIVLNITRPYEHFEVSLAALNAGKNVYSEKPLAATLEQGAQLKKLAAEKGLFLGGAPDTFMGAGIQTCRKLIDEGAIGTPVGAAAFMICRGHESWHPDPEFYYKHGGGPMLDMGPYYLTALVNLLGPVEAVSGMTRASFPQRLITSEPKNGTVIDVDVPTYTTGLLRFKSGAIGTIFTTFDVHYTQGARLEVYGSEGTLLVPDPNGFGGDVMLLRAGSKEYEKIPLCFNYETNSRALGLADMAKAMQTGRHHRANSDQTYHVLEIMESIIKSSDSGHTITLGSGLERGAPMPGGGTEGILD
ncbi:MAG: Gfo/Idh/MocA family oxidoreductase [Clostridiales bacterium]|nr:Gfo/Idh/MocA family oxidoreductase [Clostridiales bacterium]